MILKITQKESKRLKELQKNGFFEAFAFELPDGSHWKCTTPAAAGLREIMRFRSRKKKEREAQSKLDLLLDQSNVS